MRKPFQLRSLSLIAALGLVSALICQCQMGFAMPASDNDHCAAHSAPSGGDTEEPGESGLADCCAMGATSMKTVDPIIGAPGPSQALPIVKSTTAKPYPDLGRATLVIELPPGIDRILDQTCSLLI